MDWIVGKYLEWVEVQVVDFGLDSVGVKFQSQLVIRLPNKLISSQAFGGKVNFSPGNFYR